MVYVYMCVYLSIYIYIYIYTHTGPRHAHRPGRRAHHARGQARKNINVCCRVKRSISIQTNNT